MKWRVYYSDGKVFQGDGHPRECDVPTRDVMAIVQTHPDMGWHSQAKSDYYVWRDGRFVGVDIFGLFDFLLDRGDVLFGRTVLPGEFRQVYARAIKDMDEQLRVQKTCHSKDERQPEGNL